MRSFATVTMLALIAFLWEGPPSAQASQPGVPPNNLPPGSAYLPGPTAMVLQPSWVPGPNFRANSYPKPASGLVFSRINSGGHKFSATPIQLPGVQKTAKIRASHLRPRPYATPIPLP